MSGDATGSADHSTSTSTPHKRDDLRHPQGPVPSRRYHPGRISLGGDSLGTVAWEINLHPEVEQWFLALADDDADGVADAIETLAEHGPGLGRPLVNRISSSRYHHMKELRPVTARGRIRILFCFDPTARPSSWSRATRPASGARGTSA